MAREKRVGSFSVMQEHGPSFYSGGKIGTLRFMRIALPPRRTRPFKLCPIWTPLYIHGRQLYRFLRDQIPKLLSSVDTTTPRIIDVGSGEMPYRDLFTTSMVDCTYEAADIEGAP